MAEEGVGLAALARMCDEASKFDLADIPDSLLESVADVLSANAAIFRRELMRRRNTGGKVFRGPDPKPKGKKK